MDRRPDLPSRGFNIQGTTPETDPQADLTVGDLRITRRPPACTRNGAVLPIPPQAFQLLLLLADSDGQVATREEIRIHIWGAENYGDHEKGINFLVHQLRSVLDDQPTSPKYIETVPRYGYRLLPPAEPAGTDTSQGQGEAVAKGSRRKGILAAGFIGLLVCIGWLALMRGSDPAESAEDPTPELSGSVLEAFSAAQYQITRYRELETEIWPNLDLLRRAEERLRLVVEAAPDFAPGHTTLAEVMLLVGDGEQCAASIEKALALTPDDPETLVIAAKFNFYHARRFDVALDQVDRALTKDWDRVNSLLLRARILTAMGRHRESQLTLIEELDLSSRSPGLVREAARLAFHGSNFDEALVLAREAITLEPKDTVAWRSVLESHEQMGKEMSAVAAANDFLEEWGHGSNATQSMREFRQIDLKHRMWGEVEGDNLASRGTILLLLGEEEEAFEALLEGCRQGAVSELPYLRVDPRFDPFRGSAPMEELERCVFESIPAVPASESN